MHWACLLLIEYAWLGLPGAVSDEKRMKMLMFGGAVLDSLQFSRIANNSP